MEPWVIGLIAVFVVGVGVIIFGAVRDRTLNRRRAAEMLAPPSRTIPHFDATAPAPHYLSDLQARRIPERTPSTELTATERQVITGQLAAADTVTIRSGFASKDFVTDKVSGWAVLDEPRILVCADPVTSIRELLGVIEKLIFSHTALVLAAPEIAADVRATLEVNKIKQLVQVIVVTAPAADLTTIADATHASPVDRTDRQAGYVDQERLGRCARWVSTAKSSHMIIAARLEQSR